MPVMTNWLTHFVDERHQRLVYITQPAVYGAENTNPNLRSYSEVLQSIDDVTPEDLDETVMSDGEVELEWDGASLPAEEKSRIVRGVDMSIDQLLRRMLKQRETNDDESVTSQQEAMTSQRYESKQPHPLYVFSHKEQYLDTSRDLLVGEIKFDKR